MFSSVYMTVVLAFERYQAITNPVKYRSKMVGTSMNSHLISNVVPGFSFAVIYYIPKFLDLYVGEEKDWSRLPKKNIFYQENDFFCLHDRPCKCLFELSTVTMILLFTVETLLYPTKYNLGFAVS